MNHGMPQQVRQPPSVLVIGFVSLAHFYFLRIGQPSCCSQSRSRSSSAIIVPNRRVCFRASPCNGPVITQTAKNSFPTSMPAHRSTAAQIMSALLYADWRTVDVFLEYVLPRLNCSIRGCFTSTWPVSFSGQSARHYLLQPPSPVLQRIVLRHFHFRGWPNPVIPFRFVVLPKITPRLTANL